jgi:drug/metabolite transporter (DMT)-like permease
VSRANGGRNDAVLSLSIILLVLLAGLIHAVWNALAKGIGSQSTSFALMNLGIAVVSWLALPFIGLPRAQAWPFVLASVACHIGYQLFLMGSYERANFSRAYPIARGVAPLLVSLGALVFASEHVGLKGLAGIVFIVIGIVSLAYVRNATRLDRVGVYWALATGVAIAVYTVVDGLGVRKSHDTLRYAVVLFALQATIWLVAVVWRRGWRWTDRPSTFSIGIIAGLMSLVAYTLVLYAQTRAPLGVVSALRETGVVWAAAIGVVIFKEGKARAVMVPALAVVVGIALLSLH